MKRSWNLLNNFPDLEKVWKIEIESWKNGKKSWVVLKVTISALQVKFFFVLVKSYSIFPLHLQCIMKEALFLQFFLRSLFDNLESGKSLEFWIQKSVWTLYYSLRSGLFRNNLQHCLGDFCQWNCFQCSLQVMKEREMLLLMWVRIWDRPPHWVLGPVLKTVCGFFIVLHNLLYVQWLWDGAYGFPSLSEKTRKSNRLQKSLQR